MLERGGGNNDVTYMDYTVGYDMCLGVRDLCTCFFNKNSLNNKIINTVVLILCIVLIYIIISSIIIWEKTSNLFYIIFGVIVILGILFNIYLLLKEKN